MDGLMGLKFFSEGRSFRPGRRVTALHLAAYLDLPWLAGRSIQHDPNVVQDIAAANYIQPLIFAAEKGSTEVVRILLENGADPNWSEKDGWTALHWAARNNHPATVALLIEHHVELDAEDSYRLTALDWAMDRQHWDAAAMIVKAGGSQRRQGWYGRIFDLSVGREHLSLHDISEGLRRSFGGLGSSMLQDRRRDIYNADRPRRYKRDLNMFDVV